MPTYTVTATATASGPRMREIVLREKFDTREEAAARFLGLMAEMSDTNLWLAERNGEWTLTLAEATLNLGCIKPAWEVTA